MSGSRVDTARAMHEAAVPVVHTGQGEGRKKASLEKEVAPGMKELVQKGGCELRVYGISYNEKGEECILEIMFYDSRSIII